MYEIALFLYIRSHSGNFVLPFWT